MRRRFPPMDGYISSTQRLRVLEDRLSLPGPAFLRGVRILFATDIHMRPEMDAGKIAALLDQQPADLILFGGDFADTRAEALRLFRALRALKAPLGIFAARGNNDTEAFGTEEALAEALDLFGCRLLVNRAETLSLPGGLLEIGGIDEYKHGAPDDAALTDSRADYRILLSHYPILRPGLRPDLMLCGHTHGGQFNFLGLTPYAIGFERVGGGHSLSPRRVSGFEQVGGTALLVSKGVGASRVPLRAGVRPEIHRILFEG